MQEMTEQILAIKPIVLVAWVSAFLVLERLQPAAPFPHQDGPLSWRRVTRNLGLWLVAMLVSLTMVLPVSVWACSVTLYQRPEVWSGVPGLLIDIILLDFWIYWWHRANHEVPFLWRFHEVHHLDHFLDTSSAIRFHFGELFLSALVRVPVIIALQIPLSSVLVFETLVLLSASFHHSNLRLPTGLERGLSQVIVTPSIHWIHHHAVRRDTDSNYCTVLSVWDRCFGTSSPNRRTPEMPIGVENCGEKSLSALLKRPFRSAAGAPRG